MTPDLLRRLSRKEGGRKTGDVATDEAYEYSGVTFRFFAELFDRASIELWERRRRLSQSFGSLSRSLESLVDLSGGIGLVAATAVAGRRECIHRQPAP
jgi:hypothetical protein